MVDSNNDLLNALERIEQHLDSLERWLRFANMDKLRTILGNELTDDRKKLVYEHSDGSRGYREVGQVTGVPAPTVQSWWIRWFPMGIMEQTHKRSGRVQRICSLKDVGIDVPILSKNNTQSKSESKNIPDETSN